MLRVRDDQKADARAPVPETLSIGRTVKPAGALRGAALGLLGLALGAGGVVLTVSVVQAENDAGIREFFTGQASNAVRYAAPPHVSYNSTRAYAPADRRWYQNIFEQRSDGRLAQPQIELNPFKPRAKAAAAPVRRKKNQVVARLDAVSGAADVARTICVRLCDGFHAPIGYLRSQAEMKGHEALCQAMNPGIPVKVFRVAAGADTIDNAQAADGRRYGALPVAYGHEKAGDPACRPAIVQAGERRVSLLRDFTLRPGDSVVLDGKVRTFAGSQRWPYRAQDFRDFRSSADLSKGQRRKIDVLVGISRMEAQATSLRRRMRLREASVRDDTFASDATMLRGTLAPANRATVRIIPISR
jgi:hypothetical protein